MSPPGTATSNGAMSPPGSTKSNRGTSPESPTKKQRAHKWGTPKKKKKKRKKEENKKPKYNKEKALLEKQGPGELALLPFLAAKGHYEEVERMSRMCIRNELIPLINEGLGR